VWGGVLSPYHFPLIDKFFPDRSLGIAKIRTGLAGSPRLSLDDRQTHLATPARNSRFVDRDPFIRFDRCRAKNSAIDKFFLGGGTGGEGGCTGQKARHIFFGCRLVYFSTALDTQINTGGTSASTAADLLSSRLSLFLALLDTQSAPFEGYQGRSQHAVRFPR